GAGRRRRGDPMKRYSYEELMSLDGAGAPAQDSSRTVAITRGTIVTVGPQGTLAGVTLLIKVCKITAVGKDVQVPAGALVIDAKGRYVIPGIIDCHSHTAIEGSVNEGSEIVTPEVRVRDVIEHDDVNIYRELAG